MAETLAFIKQLTGERSRLAVAGLVGIFGVMLLISAAGSPGLGFSLFIAGIIGVIALYRPELVVGLLALYLPFEPFVLKYVPDDLYVYIRYGSEGLIYLLAAAAVIYRLRTHTKPSLGPFGLALIALAGSLIVSAGLNHVPALTALLGLRQILRFSVLGLAVVNLPVSHRFIRKLIWLLIAVAAFESGLGLLQSAVGPAADSLLIPSETRAYGSYLLTPGTDQFWVSGQRVTATLGRYDQLGAFLSFALLLTVGLLYELKKVRLQRYLFVALLLGVGCLALTYSRASWLGFGAGLAVVALLIKRDRRVLLAGVIIALALILYPFVTSLAVNNLRDQPDVPFIDRIYEAVSYERWQGEYYGLGRLYFIVATATKVFPAAPVFGFGPGQYGGGAAAALGNLTVYDQLSLPFGIYGYAGMIDNNWLSLLGEAGLVGILLYLAVLAGVIRFSLKFFRQSQNGFDRGLALATVGVVVAVSLEACLGTYLEVRTIGVYLWLLPALLFVLSKSKTSPINDSHENNSGQ